MVEASEWTGDGRGIAHMASIDRVEGFVSERKEGKKRFRRATWIGMREGDSERRDVPEGSGSMRQGYNASQGRLKRLATSCGVWSSML